MPLYQVPRLGNKYRFHSSGFSRVFYLFDQRDNDGMDFRYFDHATFVHLSHFRSKDQKDCVYRTFGCKLLNNILERWDISVTDWRLQSVDFPSIAACFFGRKLLYNFVLQAINHVWQQINPKNGRGKIGSCFIISLLQHLLISAGVLAYIFGRELLYNFVLQNKPINHVWQEIVPKIDVKK